jgi:hypothetical protein
MTGVGSVRHAPRNFWPTTVRKVDQVTSVVSLGKPYYIGKRPLTPAQLEANGSKWGTGWRLDYQADLAAGKLAGIGDKGQSTHWKS